MKMSFDDHGNVTVLTMSGALTADQQETFRRICEDRFEHGINDVVLDMEHVTRVDSSGLEMMLWLQEEAALHQGRLKIVGADDALRITLRVTRLDGRFDLHDTIEAAAKSLRAA